MKRLTVAHSGMSTAASYEDGASQSLVNLRLRNGQLQPVAPRKVIRSLAKDYNLLLQHKGTYFENLIGLTYTDDGTSAYWVKDGTEEATIFEDLPDHINSVEQSGNLLTFISSTDTYYAMYLDGAYKFYGVLPALQPAEVGVMSEEYVMATYSGDYFLDNGWQSWMESSEVLNLIKTMQNLALKKAKEKYIHENGMKADISGYFHDAFFFRYAYRLFDGTWVKHSAPILVMPQEGILDMRKILINVRGKEGDHDYDIQDVYTVHDDNLPNDKVRLWLDGNEGGVKMDVFIPGVRYDFSSLEGYKGIIESVDFFITPAIGLASTESVRLNIVNFDLVNQQYTWQNISDQLPDNYMDKVKDMASYYRVRSINLDSDSLISKGENNEEGGWEKLLAAEEDVQRYTNLTAQEALTVDTFSHHREGAQVSYTYNRRLHLGDIETTFFKGFDYQFFRWDYNKQNYNGFEYLGVPYQEGDQIVIETKIVASGSTGIVQSVYDIHGENDPVFGHMSAFISYPDSRAKSMTFYYKHDGKAYRFREFSLTPHSFLNIAYYLDEQLFGIDLYKDFAREKLDYTEIAEPFALMEHNKLKTSETDNPMRFPNENANYIGSSAILAMTSNLMNVGDRNYGQYPLYVFTEEGVWSMQVGTTADKAYTSLSTPTASEAPLSNVICSTPFGAVYLTRRGIFVINGQKAVCISDVLNEQPQPLKFELCPSSTDPLMFLYPEWLLTYIKHVTAIYYNPFENEVIFVNPEYPYSYVFDAGSKSYYLSTESADAAVQNSLPDLLIKVGTDIKSYAEVSEGATNVSMLTRPINFGTWDIKFLERLMLRATLHNLEKNKDGINPCVMEYCSDDAINFICARGLSVREGNHKDLDLGLTGRNKFRFFSAGFAGVVGSLSRFSLIDAAVEKVYDSSKLR